MTGLSLTIPTRSERAKPLNKYTMSYYDSIPSKEAKPAISPHPFDSPEHLPNGRMPSEKPIEATESTEGFQPEEVPETTDPSMETEDPQQSGPGDPPQTKEPVREPLERIEPLPASLLSTPQMSGQLGVRSVMPPPPLNLTAGPADKEEELEDQEGKAGRKVKGNAEST